LPKKRAWIQVIRPVRERLKELRQEGRINPSTYRKLYMQAKGGMFRSRSHLEQQLRVMGILKEAEK